MIRTAKNRPDLLKKAQLTEAEKKMLEEMGIGEKRNRIDAKNQENPAKKRENLVWFLIWLDQYKLIKPELHGELQYLHK